MPEPDHYCHAGHADCDFDIDCTVEHVVHDDPAYRAAVNDEPAVTVDDLLDAYYNDKPGSYYVLRSAASDDVWSSFYRVANVLDQYRSLSPAERTVCNARTRKDG